MLRKIALFLFGCVLLSTLAAVGLMMATGSPQSQINEVVLAAFVAAIALLVIACRSSQRRSAPGHPVVVHQADRMRYFGTGLNDRPVMTYKGQVYDFVHNDPTAPDPA